MEQQANQNSYIKNFLNDENSQSASDSTSTSSSNSSEDQQSKNMNEQSNSQNSRSSSVSLRSNRKKKTYEEQQDNYRKKKYYLDGLKRLHLQGDYTFYTPFTINTSLNELRYEYEQAQDNAHKKAYVRNARQYLYYTALGVETLNENYNKLYKLELNGFSQNISNHSFEYDYDFEQLYYKYGSLDSYLPPEISIIGKFAISLVMTHWTNNVIKGTNKDADPKKVFDDNPGLKATVEKGIVNSMQQGFQNSTGLGSLIGNVMQSSWDQQNNQQTTSQNVQMKGPRDDMRQIMEEISQEQNQANPFDKSGILSQNTVKKHQQSDMQTIQDLDDIQSNLDELSSIKSKDSNTQKKQSFKKGGRGRPKKQP